MNTLFDGLISSRTRIALLMRLFLNPDRASYLRELAKDLSVAPSQMRGELQSLKDAGLLSSEKQGRQIYYRANDKHSLFPELQSMVKKALGMDQILDSILDRLGNLEQAFLVGDYANGIDSGVIDLVLVGAIDKANLSDLTEKTERYIGRKIRTLVFTADEFDKMTDSKALESRLLLWRRDI